MSDGKRLEPEEDADRGESATHWPLGLDPGALGCGLGMSAPPPSETQEEAWRRKSVDAKMAHTAATMASAEERGCAKEKECAGADPQSSSVFSSASAWSPRIEVECVNVNLWVKPLFVKGRCCPRLSSVCATPLTTLEEGSDHRGSGVPRSPRAACHEGMVQILHDISFKVCPGEVVFVLGPSGSGKTSLVTAVAGRIKRNGGGRGGVGASDLEGHIMFNGVDRYDDTGCGNMARSVGFVTQDDCLFPSLTVRETLKYAALLRLPSVAMSRSAKLTAAADVAAQLGLDSCADTIIGGVFTRGVSGGERKRVSIAVELLTDPSILILDEPTSGLDSTIALRLADTLATLARCKGRTVLLTIHQPSSRITATMDAVLLLSRGRRVYYGAVSGVASYFSQNMGYVMPFGMNPADFMIDLANGDTSACRGLDTSSGARTVSEAPDEVVARLVAACGTLPGRVDGKGNRPAPYPAAAGSTGKPSDGSPPRGARAACDDSGPSRSPPRWACSWPEQVGLLFWRSLAARRGQLFDSLKLTQVVVVALMVGALWWQRGSDPGSEAVSDTAGLLFFELLFLSFLTLFGSLFTFPDERAITVKERQSGMYRVSAYFTARSLTDVPLDLFTPCIFIPIVYWMAGLRAAFVPFVSHVAAVMLQVLVASSMGLLIGACLTKVKQAQTVASVIMLAVMLTGGFYFDKTPHWLNWTKQVSFMNHAYTLVLKIQFPRGEFPCVTVQEPVRGRDETIVIDSPSISGAVGGVCNVHDAGMLTFVDMEDGVSVNVGALLAILAGMRGLTYVALRFISLRS